MQFFFPYKPLLKFLLTIIESLSKDFLIYPQKAHTNMIFYVSLFLSEASPQIL